MFGELPQSYDTWKTQHAFDDDYADDDYHSDDRNAFERRIDEQIAMEQEGEA